MKTGNLTGAAKLILIQEQKKWGVKSKAALKANQNAGPAFRVGYIFWKLVSDQQTMKGPTE